MTGWKRYFYLKMIISFLKTIVSLPRWKIICLFLKERWNLKTNLILIKKKLRIYLLESFSLSPELALSSAISLRNTAIWVWYSINVIFKFWFSFLMFWISFLMSFFLKFSASLSSWCFFSNFYCKNIDF